MKSNKYFLKALVIIAGILILPALFSTFINMMITLEYWRGRSCEEIKTLQLNYSFAFWGCWTGLLSFAFIIVSFGMMWKYIPNIDKLEILEDELLKSKKEMEQARDKYTELLKK